MIPATLTINWRLTQLAHGSRDSLFPQNRQIGSLLLLLTIPCSVLASVWFHALLHDRSKLIIIRRKLVIINSDNDLRIPPLLQCNCQLLFTIEDNNDEKLHGVRRPHWNPIVQKHSYAELSKCSIAIIEWINLLTGDKVETLIPLTKLECRLLFFFFDAHLI